MADNGFGQKGNSADFLLRAYRIRPDFETTGAGSGEILIGEFARLRDPDRQVPFEITNQESGDRLLTGADFDIESMRRDGRGDLWFGDEFGPFLLHTEAIVVRTEALFTPSSKMTATSGPPGTQRRASAAPREQHPICAGEHKHEKHAIVGAAASGCSASTRYLLECPSK